MFISKSLARRLPFWGWVIVATTLTVICISAGTAYYANSIYLLPLTHHFNTGRTAIAQVYALTNLFGAATMPLVGLFVDRWGPRRAILIGIVGMAVCFFLLSRLTTLWQFYVLVIIQQSLFMRFNELITLQAMIGRWFVRLRGRATGLTMTGVGIGGLILPAVSGMVIQNYGWRSGYLLGGVLIAGISLPAAFFLLRDRPDELGQYPDGASEPPAIAHSTAAGATFAEAVRSPALWILAVASFLCYITHGVLALQLPAMLQDAGLSVSSSASFLGLMLGFSIIGRLGIGTLSDRFDKPLVLAASMLGMALSASLMMAPANALARILFVIGYGISMGGTFTVMPLTGQALFGQRSFGRIYAVVALSLTLGASVGNYLGARVYDWQGNYVYAVALAGGASVLAALLTLALRRRGRITETLKG